MKTVYALLATLIIGAIVLGSLYALGLGGIASGWCSGVAMSFTAMYFMRDEKKEN